MNKVIYFLPAEGTRSPVSAYQSSTLDLYFNIVNESTGLPVDGLALTTYSLYEFSLGLTSYSHLEAPDCLVLPRSSASKINSGGTANLIAGESEDVGMINMSNRDNLNVKIMQQTVSFRLANTLGLIDRDYRGNWIARGGFDYWGSETARRRFWLDNSKPWLQAWCPDPEYKLQVVSSLEEIPVDYRHTLRGSGGFGSSNK